MKGQTHIMRGTAALHCGETPETWERGGLPSVQTKRKPRPVEGSPNPRSDPLRFLPWNLHFPSILSPGKPDPPRESRSYPGQLRGSSTARDAPRFPASKLAEPLLFRFSKQFHPRGGKTVWSDLEQKPNFWMITSE